jgi:hypothetical protein
MKFFPCIAEGALVDSVLYMVDSDHKHRAALVDSLFCMVDSDRKLRA